ncbi:RodZ domain-containing protein [Lusitaniella coriacea]|uniref:helix-turn-helix domain-containing protein n=1 Tax=Lusitaniella coriacea TaxID=1983105 RepID=UPI003CEBD3F5
MTQNSNFRPEQIEKIKELGSDLQEIRQTRSLSLEQVSTKTLIPLRSLRAIEEADLEVLPEPIYLKGLLKRYAQFLGLNGTEFIADFSLDNTFKALTPSWKPLPSRRKRFFPLYLLYVLGVISAISAFSAFSQRSALEVGNVPKAETQTSPSPKPVRESPVAMSPRVPQSATSISTAQRPPEQPVTVDMTLKEDCWLQIVADGKTTFEGTLNKGDKRTWEASQELVIRAGNAGGVEIAVNDEQAKPLGEPGAVETVTYQASEDSSESQGG